MVYHLVFVYTTWYYHTHKTMVYHGNSCHTVNHGIPYHDTPPGICAYHMVLPYPKAMVNVIHTMVNVHTKWYTMANYNMVHHLVYEDTTW